MAFRINSLTKAFGETQVLENISLEFSEGSISVILGPSGCGKTTLLNIIAGLTSFEGGRREGFDTTRFSYAFQEPRLLPWLNARENAALALSGAMPRVAALARVDGFLEAAGLFEAARRKPEELSGGMRQRLSLVRAFAYPADFLLLDEAFTAVDLKTKLEIMDVFLRLWEAERPTVVCVTHDVDEALYLADRVVVLSERPGRIIDDFLIGVERPERSLGSKSTIEAESRLLNLVLGKG